MTSQSEVSAGPTVAQSLREVADWLDLHPEMGVQHAFVSVTATEREHLEALAAALGDRAQENETYGPGVEIRGEFGGGAAFGGVQVYGSVPLAKLADAPVKPKYRSILPPADESADDRFERLTGEGRR